MQTNGSKPGKKKHTQKQPKTLRPRSTETSRKRAHAVRNIDEKESNNSGSAAAESERTNEELRGTVDSRQFSATNDKEAALKNLFTWLRK